MLVPHYVPKVTINIQSMFHNLDMFMTSKCPLETLLLLFGQIAVDVLNAASVVKLIKMFS